MRGSLGVSGAGVLGCSAWWSRNISLQVWLGSNPSSGPSKTHSDPAGRNASIPLDNVLIDGSALCSVLTPTEGSLPSARIL